MQTATTDRTPAPSAAELGEGESEVRNKRSKMDLLVAADKKFECEHVDCGKKYSRAEHLHRHRLNREPTVSGPGHIRH